MTFLWAGYGLTWLALAVYAWRLEDRQRAAERELSLHRGDAGAVAPAAEGDHRDGRVERDPRGPPGAG